jgi:hypothetical protein
MAAFPPLGWAALLLAAVEQRRGRSLQLVRGQCYRWVIRYSPRLSDQDWAAVVAFHRQFGKLGGEPKTVDADRAEQRIAYNLVQQADATVNGLGVMQRATWLPAPLGSRIQGTWTVYPCEGVPEA